MSVEVTRTDNRIGGPAQGGIGLGQEGTLQGGEGVGLPARREVGRKEAELQTPNLHVGEYGTARDKSTGGQEPDGGGEEDGDPTGGAAPARGGGGGVDQTGPLKVGFPDRHVGVSPVSLLQEDHRALLDPGTEASAFASGRVRGDVSKRPQVPGDTRGESTSRWREGGEGGIRNVQEVSPSSGRRGVAPMQGEEESRSRAARRDKVALSQKGTERAPAGQPGARAPGGQ